MRSMDWSDNGLLVGTHASEIVVVRGTAAECEVVVRGHAQRVFSAGAAQHVAPDTDDATEIGALRAVAVPLQRALCATGGDDGVVRLWDLRSHALLSSRIVHMPVSSLTFDESNTDVARLAVGFEDGSWEVVQVRVPFGTDTSSSTLAGVAEHAHNTSDRPSRRVTDMRFSPDERWLALASADAVIYLYDSANGYSLVARSYGHTSSIVHLDWSATSDVIRSNDQGHELRFWDAPSGQAITAASACRDLPWASARVTLGYHCQGIFRSSADGTGVHAVDRSYDSSLLVTADDLGQLNLFRYPCVRAETCARSNRKSFAAHASAVLSCCWACNGPRPDEEYVISAGGYDLTLMQWRRIRKAES